MKPTRFAPVVLTLAALVLGSCATHDGPRIRGDRDRFQLTIGIGRADEVGGPDSDGMKRIIDEEVKRAGYCPDGYSVRLSGNTAAQYIFVGQCTSKRTKSSNYRFVADAFRAAQPER